MNVLVLSRNYPSSVVPYLGIWVEGLVRHLRPYCEQQVIAPVPYCPPMPRFVPYSHYRRIESFRLDDGIRVWHPRYPTGPGYSLHSVEATLYEWGIRKLAIRLHRDKPFDLIHAHFSYPDGVVASRLAERFGVPVVITEHARWRPWMERFPGVRRRAVAAARACDIHMPVSRFVQETIFHFTGPADNFTVVPVGTDTSVFKLSVDGCQPDPHQILFVGRIHRVKGVDILLQGMVRLVQRRPEFKLTMVGGGFLFGDYRRQEKQMRDLARQLGLNGHVQFVGPLPPSDVAEWMRKSGVVVLPSRAETFGAVLIEALACGTPVVATRCGGPEEIVRDGLGVLVPMEDPQALAEALEGVLDERETYDPQQLSQHARHHYSWDSIARRTCDLYRQAVMNFRKKSKSGRVNLPEAVECDSRKR